MLVFPLNNSIQRPHSVGYCLFHLVVKQQAVYSQGSSTVVRNWQLDLVALTNYEQGSMLLRVTFCLLLYCDDLQSL